MEILLLFFLLLSTTSGQISSILEPTCENNFPNVNVVGGENIKVEKVPWNAVLELKKNQNAEKISTHCGGNIISSTVILTAAHCVWGNHLSLGRNSCPENVRNQESAFECHQLPGGCPQGCLRMRPQDLNIYVGITNTTQTERRPLKVKHIIVHELWNKSTSSKESIKTGHDMALIILEEKLQFTLKIRPICLPDPDYQNLLEAGEKVYINGFGIVDVETRTLATHLQTGNMQIKDMDECNAEYDESSRRQNIIQGDQLCPYSNVTDSCSGDSGSGLLKYVGSVPVLVGVVSFGHRECRDLPGVYTNVQTHVQWILSKIENFARQAEVLAENITDEIPQTHRNCSENETCEARETCPYIQLKYDEVRDAETKEQRRSLIKKLKDIVCNRAMKAFCCQKE